MNPARSAAVPVGRDRTDGGILSRLLLLRRGNRKRFLDGRY